MNCPETGHSCFDLDCQLHGCQGDGVRRMMNQLGNAAGANPLPVPRTMIDTTTANPVAPPRLKIAA